MKRHLRLLLAVTVAGASQAALAPAASAQTCAIPAAPAAGTINETDNVVYSSPTTGPVLLDAMWPLATSAFKGPRPVVVMIHAGGWRAGDKGSRDADARLLASIGYTVININYRETWFPVQESDARCAVRWIKANAAKYNADPARVGTLGLSAGAHLAASLAIDTNTVGLDDGTCKTAGSPAVVAMVGYYGVYDLTAAGATTPGEAPWLSGFLGCTPTDPACTTKATLASPIKHLASSDPEMLLLNGSADTFVPPVQTANMVAAARGVGVAVTQVVEPGANHGYQPFGTTTPTSTCATLAFLARKLKP